MEMDRAGLEASLNEALLTAEEMARGPRAGSNLKIRSRRCSAIEK
jgi:hypothetical protein